VVDDLTYKALQKALLEAELPIDLPHKDRERLLTIRRFDKPLTYSEWGRLLGLTREGAYYLLKRLEAKGLLKLTKCERGVEVEVKTF
jgi:predicted ArsR family transcriptional regulator